MLQSNLADDLIALAAERSSEKRVELLRRVIDVYLDHPVEHSAAEQGFFEEVITNIMAKIQAGHKAAASAKLAKLPSLPDALARELGSDKNIRVALPIIRDYRGLSEDALVDIAKVGSQFHLKLIAGRPVVTPPVSDVVVERGDRNTVRTLASNGGAQFSVKGMEKLIDKASADSDLQALIVARGDLTMGAIIKLLPMISDELASRLRSVSVEVDQATVAVHLGEWAAERKQSIERTDGYIDRIRKNDLKLNEVVLDLVKTKRLFDAATVIGAMTGLDRAYCFQVLTAGRLESMLLLMRSVNLSWPAADGFFRLRAAKAGIGGFGPLPTRFDYEAIDAPTAQRAIRFMKVQRVAGAEAAASSAPRR